MSSLKPVRTREDCISWLTLEDVEREVFGAFIGAKRHAQKFDFAAYHADASGSDPAYELQADTVLFSDGQPAWDRAEFLQYLAAGIVWRLEALAKRKGVDLEQFDPASLIASPAFASEGFSAPYFAYLGGEVLDVTADQLTAAQRKALKSGKPVTVPQGTIVRR
ncbi:MAG: hypothetical protein E2582_15880 [Delftia sp.]|nr:hypothetical protein [Delftia sp.]